MPNSRQEDQEKVDKKCQQLGYEAVRDDIHSPRARFIKSNEFPLALKWLEQQAKKQTKDNRIRRRTDLFFYVATLIAAVAGAIFAGLALFGS